MSTYDGSLFCISNWLNHRGNLASLPQDLLWMLKEFRPQNKDFWLNIACGAGILLVERGIGIFGFAVLAIFLIGFSVFVPKKLRFFGFNVHCSLRIFRILAFSFRFLQKIVTGFRIWYSMPFSVFSYLNYFGSGFSSIWAAITCLHWSRIAAKRKCYREECVTNQLKYRRDP